KGPVRLVLADALGQLPAEGLYQTGVAAGVVENALDNVFADDHAEGGQGPGDEVAGGGLVQRPEFKLLPPVGERRMPQARVTDDTADLVVAGEDEPQATAVGGGLKVAQEP